MVGQIESCQRGKGKSRRTIENDEIAVHAEMLHQPFHAAAYLQGNGVGVEILFGLLEVELTLDVLQLL